jgi:hypothetical protein
MGWRSEELQTASVSVLPPAQGLEWTYRKQHHAAAPTDLTTATRRNVTGCDHRHGHVDLQSLTRGTLRSGPGPRRRPARPCRRHRCPGVRNRSNPNVLVLAVWTASLGARWGAIIARRRTAQSAPSGSISVNNQASSYGGRRQPTGRISFVSRGSLGGLQAVRAGESGPIGGLPRKSVRDHGCTLTRPKGTLPWRTSNWPDVQTQACRSGLQSARRIPALKAPRRRAA